MNMKMHTKFGNAYSLHKLAPLRRGFFRPKFLIPVSKIPVPEASHTTSCGVP